MQHPVVVFRDQLPIVCVSNKEISPPDCNVNEPMEQILFVGVFDIDDSGSGYWVFPDVTLRQYDIDGLVESEFATKGSMTLYEYDPAGGRLSLSMELPFTSGLLTGTVSVP